MSRSNVSTGVDVTTVIFLILLILKLFKVIDISWWWVFSPLLIGLGLGLLAFLIVIILLFIKSK